MFCQYMYMYLWMYVAPAADLYRPTAQAAAGQADLVLQMKHELR